MAKKDISIKEKDYTLAATIIVPKSTRSQEIPAVVFYHGMVSQRKPRYNKRAEMLAKNGIAALTFDFRGCGESDGKLGEISLEDWFKDALLAFDYLGKHQFVDKNRIGISGKSFGGYMGALVCAKRNIKSMVLQAPAVYDDIWFTKKYEYYKDEFKEKRRDYRNSKNALQNKAIRAIKKFTNPLLIVGSERDDVCPRNVVEGYYTASPSKNKNLVWIKSADHPLTKEIWNREYTMLMSDWFTKTL